MVDQHQYSTRPGAPVIDELTGPEWSARDSGQLEIVDAEQCHVDTGGKHEDLFEWHVALVQEARRQGYPGVAMTSDDAAAHVITPVPEQLLAHERDFKPIDRRAGSPGAVPL